jgi:hypothetical protein
MLTLQCPSCGSYNDETATVCYSCKKPLPVPAARAGSRPLPVAVEPIPSGNKRAARYPRPGCVTIYAALLFLSGISGMFSLLVFLGNSSTFNLSTLSSQLAGSGEVDPGVLKLLPAYFAGFLILLFLLSILNLVVGWGLWAMRNWARIYVLATQGLSILSGVPLLFLSIALTKGNLCVGILYFVPLVISGYICLWFIENRKLFR